MEKIILVILGSVVANYLLGTIKAVGKGFSWKLFFNGLGGVVKKEIALLVLIFAYQYFGDVEVIDIVYAPIFYFIAGLSGIYHINSALVNVCALLGLENVKVLGELDDKFKELMNKSFFKKEGTE